MKRVLAGALALSLLAVGAASAHPHMHKVCTIHHHHRVCHWVR